MAQRKRRDTVEAAWIFCEKFLFRGEQIAVSTRLVFEPDQSKKYLELKAVGLRLSTEGREVVETIPVTLTTETHHGATIVDVALPIPGKMATLATVIISDVIAGEASYSFDLKISGEDGTVDLFRKKIVADMPEP